MPTTIFNNTSEKLVAESVITGKMAPAKEQEVVKKDTSEKGKDENNTAVAMFKKKEGPKDEIVEESIDEKIDKFAAEFMEKIEYVRGVSNLPAEIRSQIFGEMLKLNGTVELSDSEIYPHFNHHTKLLWELFPNEAVEAFFTKNTVTIPRMGLIHKLAIAGRDEFVTQNVRHLMLEFNVFEDEYSSEDHKMIDVLGRFKRLESLHLVAHSEHPNAIPNQGDNTYEEFKISNGWLDYGEKDMNFRQHPAIQHILARVKMLKSCSIIIHRFVPGIAVVHPWEADDDFEDWLGENLCVRRAPLSGQYDYGNQSDSA